MTRGETADLIGWLRDTAEGLFSPDRHYGQNLVKAADLLAIQAAALETAQDALKKLANFDHATADKIAIAKEALAALEVTP